MGPAIQDLWMLLSGDRDHRQAQLLELVEGYNEFHDFRESELALIEILRTMRLINYSAWLARRWTDPAFPLNFPWFNTQRYWSDHILELREQIAARRTAAAAMCSSQSAPARRSARCRPPKPNGRPESVSQFMASCSGLSMAIVAKDPAIEQRFAATLTAQS